MQGDLLTSAATAADSRDASSQRGGHPCPPGAPGTTRFGGMSQHPPTTSPLAIALSGRAAQTPGHFLNRVSRVRISPGSP